ncbi:Transcriptional activator RfaH [hydrothermal vent metagenome]|uniref:Transcriptional activator RfaH n=1 Tax=hydrothermal vent metagenome TaxID=652676 RepID=A0A3B0Y3B4_9ZZZZ
MSIASESGAKWYLVYTKPRDEQLAESNLIRQGYRVYLPLIRNRRRFRGKLKAFIEPMFPRYLFIQLDKDTDNWAPVRSTYGVSSMVYFGLKPAQIPNEIVEILTSHADENSIYQIPDEEYCKGDKLMIVDGLMAGLEGVFLCDNTKERVDLLLDYLGKQTEVNVSIHDIERMI